MTVTIRYACNGCDATVEADVQARHENVGADLVRHSIPSINRAAPDGWVAFDPWTWVTYCPACWVEIAGDDKDSLHRRHLEALRNGRGS